MSLPVVVFLRRRRRRRRRREWVCNVWVFMILYPPTRVSLNP